MDTQSDHWLIDQAVAGNTGAFSALVERHYDLIYRIAYKWCGTREDAEDVAQDVCLKLARAIRGFEGKSAFTSWLYRIVLNVVRDMQRSQVRQSEKVAALKVLAEPDYRPDPEGELTAAQIWQQVRALPDQQRDAVLLVHGEDMTHAEAAKIMECAESTVSWHIREAKKRLKQFVEVETHG